MKLKEFIIQQLEAIQDMNITSADFFVCLNEAGDVVDNSSTTIKFTLQLR